jgi:putative hemolysin
VTKGKYTVLRAEGVADMAAVFDLRALCFDVAGGAKDRFDATATHMLVRRDLDGAVVATFRMALFAQAEILNSYAAQFYDLKLMAQIDTSKLELGRFCVHPAHDDPDILRIAWAALTGFVDANDVQTLFGCSSFKGTTHSLYTDAFALLKARHLGPADRIPAVKAADVFRYSIEIKHKPDPARANAALPPLLRTYLMMGGWVSDHAVIDRGMNTLHVFTALEIGAIPEARKNRLRALV